MSMYDDIIASTKKYSNKKSNNAIYDSIISTAKKVKSGEIELKKPEISKPNITKKTKTRSDASKILENLGSGTLTGLSGISKSITTVGKYLAPLMTPAIGSKENVAKKQQEYISSMGEADKIYSNIINKKQQQMENTTSSIKSPILKEASTISGTLGNIIPSYLSYLIPVVGPVVSPIISGASSAGQYMTEAENKGASENQKLIYGAALGTLEALTNKITFGSASKALKLAKNKKITKSLFSAGITAAENAVQEAAMEPAQELTNEIVLGKSDWTGMGKRMLDSSINGVLVGIILGGASSGLGKAISITDKVRTGGTVTKTEIKQAVQEAQKNNIKPIQINTGVQAPTTQNKTVLPQQESVSVPKTQQSIRPKQVNKIDYNSKAKPNTIRLYTNTKASNIESIVKNGIDPSFAKQKEYDGKALWFETRPNLRGYGGTTIAVDLPITSNMNKVNDTQYMVYDKVSPKDIVFIDKPLFDNYRESDIPKLLDNFGIEKVKEVFNRSNNKTISNKDFENILYNYNIPTTKISQQKPTQEPISQNEPVLPQQESVTMPTQDGRVKTSNLRQSFQDTQVLNQEAKEALVNQKDLSYYESINNDTTMQQASDRIAQGGEQEAIRWTTLKPEYATPLDVAEGIILMENYQRQGQLDNMVSIAKKLTEIGTKSGQTVQMFSILQRMTPEGMVKYAQSQLTDIQNELQKTKTKDWIKQNVGDLTLTSQEVQTIIDKMKEVQNLTGREKIVKLAEINKIITDKIPPNIGNSIKAFRRIAMLLNPKTIVRNILGNAIISPANMAADSTVGTLVDKAISKITGVRTTGITNVREYTKGMLQGAVEAFDDFRRGINTRDISSDKFEIGRGKNFNNKFLNKLDILTGFTLDIGDRPYFKAEFMNSIANQMKLNNVTKPTNEMIELATNIAEQRTWQDTNAYSKAVTRLRNSLNNDTKGIGFGDLFIPFAKTPANLTKALVDYSPAGMIRAIIDSNKLNTALANDKFTPQLQKKVVDDISKASVGTLLYIVGYALAKAGIISGKADDDKDVAKFEKDVMGIQPYSVKIGDKSFTYDWAQPLASPLGIMANVVKSKEKGEQVSLLQSILTATSESGEMLYEQSFMQNFKRIFSNYGGVTQGLIETLANIPSSFVPTLIKQLNDLIDPIQRTSYEPNSIYKTSIQQVKAKLPGFSQTLAPTRDVLGREVKKFSGDNNIINVFLSPANVAKEQSTEGGKEILRLYKTTGDKTVVPRVAANSFDYKNTKYTLSSIEKSEWQKAIGTQTSNNLELLIKNSNYKDLKDADKVKVVNEILNFSQTQQKYDYLKTKGVDYELDQSFIDAKEAIDNGLSSPKYFIFKKTINNLEGDKDSKGNTINSSETAKKALAILNMDATNKEKNMLLDLASNAEKPLTVEELELLPKDKNAIISYNKLNDKGEVKFKKAIDLGIPVEEYIKYIDRITKVKGIKKNGRTISGTKKAAAIKFVQTLSLTRNQKIYLLEQAGYKMR